MSIDINCDMGEGMPHDPEIMPFISSANIACGYHAGNEEIIRQTIHYCLQHGVAVGAHPGFNDKGNFGRSAVQLSDSDLYALIIEQLKVIEKSCKTLGATLHHVKPHGALYNMAAQNRQMSAIISKAVYDFNSSLIFYGLSGSVMIEEAAAVGLKTAHEVFADRTYQDNGHLTPRANPQALIERIDSSVEQALQICKHKAVTALSGKKISVQADTLCVHGDGKHALEFAKAIHTRFLAEGIKIQTIH
jgi:UPF0271 protein